MDNAKLRARVKKLHALMGSDNEGERANARALLVELLAKHKLTWNDLPGLLAGEDAGPAPEAEPADPSAPPALDLIQEMLARHLHLTDHELVALTLWTAHTFFYQQYSVTPRLALLSPVRGCGKTTVMNLLKELCLKAQKVDHTTPASLFRLIDCGHPTMLLDEVDNQDLPVTSSMRSVLNSGHHCSGTVTRVIQGEPKSFSTFAPVALAAIGKLPLPLMHRSIVLHMERAPSANLLRFDPRTNPGQAQQCEAVYRVMFEWAKSCHLGSKRKPSPMMPAELHNRQADNWRVLFAIADADGPAWGKAARVAAVAMSGQDEDPAVELLAGMFNALHVDRLASVDLVAALLEASDGCWTEWRGPRGDQAPHRLTQASMAQLLAPFNIRSRTIWPLARVPGTKSAKGFLRSQFEAAWAAYCGGNGTPAQPSNIKHFRGTQ